MGFFDGAKGAFDFALGSRRGTRAILAGRNMGIPIDLQGLHDVLKDPALGHRPVVQVDHFWSALEWARWIGLGCHGIEQEAQRRFSILSIDAAVFQVVDAAAVIDNAEQHQGRHALGGVDPRWFFNMLEVRRRHVELPAVIAVFGLEPHGRRFACQVGVVQIPQRQVAVYRWWPEQALGRLYQAGLGFHAIAFQQLNCATGGEVSAVLVGGAQLERCDQITVTLHFRLWQDTRLTMVGAVHCVGFVKIAHGTVNRGGRNTVQAGEG